MPAEYRSSAVSANTRLQVCTCPCNELHATRLLCDLHGLLWAKAQPQCQRLQPGLGGKKRPFSWTPGALLADRSSCTVFKPVGRWSTCRKNRTGSQWAPRLPKKQHCSVSASGMLELEPSKATCGRTCLKLCLTLAILVQLSYNVDVRP